MPDMEALVAELTDWHRWPWTQMLSYDDAATLFLARLASHGFIERRKHPSGGYVYRVNGKLFGRLDDVDDSLFDVADA